MSELERDLSDERAEFHDKRTTGIGATDGPKILGFSKWGTALTVYNDKVNPEPERRSSLPAWLGNKLQATVAELYTAATDIRVRADNRHHRHPVHDFIVCHLDYRAWGQPSLLIEMKTKAYMTGWGPDGSQKIPPDVWVQVQHEMLVTGATECHVAVLFGHHTLRVYPIKRDEAFLEEYVPRLHAFWHGHILAQIPPPPMGSDLDEAALRARHPSSDGTIKAATPEQEAVIKRLRLAAANVKQAGKAELELKNKVIEIIGPADGIQGSFGRITFKQSKDSVTVDWKQIAEAYRSLIETTWYNFGFDAKIVLADGSEHKLRKRDRVDLDAIESVYTRTEPGSRRWYATYNEETA